MFNTFLLYSEKRSYWLIVLLIAIMSELSALFYQYVLDYLPCVLCIHIRVWLLGVILVSVLGLIFNKYRYSKLPLHALMTLMMVGFFERSYQTLGVERGFVFGDCNMESGLPAWFALDQWIPSVFKVWEACGYTPVLLFGITMAEALIILSAILLLISSVFLMRSVYDMVNRKTD